MKRKITLKEKMKQMTNRNQSCQRGFTLVELLIVVAIIALLAAILFPAFGRAREMARRASCQSNLKELGVGLLQYAQDYDEILPRGPLANNGTVWQANRGSGWAGPVYTYVKSAQVFVCPSDTKTPNNNAQISYAFNQAMTYPINGWQGVPGLARLTEFDKTVELFEVTNATWSPAIDGPLWAYSPAGNGFQGSPNLEPGNPQAQYDTGIMGSSSSTSAPCASTAACPFYNAPTGRHLDTSNFLFMDGHVKAMQAGWVSAGLAAPSVTSAPTGNAGTYSAAGTSTTTYEGTFSPI